MVLERTLESPLDCKEIKLVSPKGNLKEIFPRIFGIPWCWSWSSVTLTTWGEELAHWKRPQCWERWKAGGKGDNRGQDGWMASLTWWTWVWARSGRWWRTGKPDLLQFHYWIDLAACMHTEVPWIKADVKTIYNYSFICLADLWDSGNSSPPIIILSEALLCREIVTFLFDKYLLGIYYMLNIKMRKRSKLSWSLTSESPCLVKGGKKYLRTD